MICAIYLICETIYYEYIIVFLVCEDNNEKIQNDHIGDKNSAIIVNKKKSMIKQNPCPETNNADKCNLQVMTCRCLVAPPMCACISKGHEYQWFYVIEHDNKNWRRWK